MSPGPTLHSFGNWNLLDHGEISLALEQIIDPVPRFIAWVLACRVTAPASGRLRAYSICYVGILSIVSIVRVEKDRKLGSSVQTDRSLQPWHHHPSLRGLKLTCFIITNTPRIIQTCYR